MNGPARRVRLDRTGLLFVLLFCNTFGLGAFGPLLPEIGRSQSLPDWQLGLVASAFGAAVGLTAGYYGGRVDAALEVRSKKGGRSRRACYGARPPTSSIARTTMEDTGRDV